MKIFPSNALRHLRGAAVALMLFVPMLSMSQTVIEPLGLSVVNTSDYSFTASIGLLTDDIYSPGGSASAATLSISNPDRIENFSVTEATNIVVGTINIAPNPVVNYIRLQTEEGIRNFSITDISGKVVIANKALTDSELTIPVEQLAAGNYILQIETQKGEKFTGKFTKK